MDVKFICTEMKKKTFLSFLAQWISTAGKLILRPLQNTWCSFFFRRSIWCGSARLLYIAISDIFYFNCCAEFIVFIVRARSQFVSLCAACPSCVARQAIAQIHFAFVFNYSLSANMLHATRCAINLLLFDIKRRLSTSSMWNWTNELPSLWNDQVECGCYQSTWVIFEVSIFM